jgi:hypothetical protein
MSLRASLWNGVIASKSTLSPEALDDNCSTPFERNLLLAKALRIRGYPHMIFSSNERISEVVDAETVETSLSND